MKNGIKGGKETSNILGPMFSLLIDLQSGIHPSNNVSLQLLNIGPCLYPSV